MTKASNNGRRFVSRPAVIWRAPKVRGKCPAGFLHAKARCLHRHLLGRTRPRLRSPTSGRWEKRHGVCCGGFLLTSRCGPFFQLYKSVARVYFHITVNRYPTPREPGVSRAEGCPPPLPTYCLSPPAAASGDSRAAGYLGLAAGPSMPGSDSIPVSFGPPAKRRWGVVPRRTATACRRAQSAPLLESARRPRKAADLLYALPR